MPMPHDCCPRCGEALTYREISELTSPGGWHRFVAVSLNGRREVIRLVDWNPAATPLWESSPGTETHELPA